MGASQPYYNVSPGLVFLRLPPRNASLRHLLSFTLLSQTLLLLGSLHDWALFACSKGHILPHCLRAAFVAARATAAADGLRALLSLQVDCYTPESSDGLSDVSHDDFALSFTTPAPASSTPLLPPAASRR
eukprot:6199289-Pleurochrysis_carterae.AAC.1